MKSVIALLPENRPLLPPDPDLHIQLEIQPNRLSGLESLQGHHFEVALIELDWIQLKEGQLGLTLAQLKKTSPETLLILVTDSPRLPEVFPLLSQGADGFLPYPFSWNDLVLLSEKLRTQRRNYDELQNLRSQFWRKESLHLVRTENQKMRAVFKNIHDVAPTKSTVLLCGETGVGKGVLARLIHEHSSRRSHHFVHVHCGAIPESLIESELFGHERGAFTGAIKRKLGKFELAHKGTIFLDEISTLTPSAQIKLLQVLQDACFQRVGGEVDIKVDIRILAATNENLKTLSDKGLFRKDLYYRLNVFPIEVPPLRERREDLQYLVESFLENLNRDTPKGILGIQSEALEGLKSYSWPGNIRELQNLVERAFILERSSWLTVESFPAEVLAENPDQALLPLHSQLPLSEARSRVIDSFERQYLKEVLSRTGGRISEAAEVAGVGVRQLNKLMNKYGLEKKEFKKLKSDAFQPLISRLKIP